MNSQGKQKHFFAAAVVCFVAASFYLYDYILRVIPAAFADQLMLDFNIHARGLGILSSAFFWGYAPMQIPCGMIYDRFSARKILTIATFFSALAALGFALTQTFVLASFYRFIMGFMTSFAFIGALVVGASWFRGQYFALYTGLVQFLGCLGAVTALSPMVLLSQHVGWRRSILIIAIVGFILSLLIWATVRDAPTKSTGTALGKAYQKSFSHPQTWWVALYGFAIWAPVTIFAALWGVPYFTEKFYHLSVIAAGNLISTIWWTIAFGGPLVGFLSKYFKTRRKLMLICSATGFFAALGTLFLPFISLWISNLLLIAYGIGCSGLVIAFGLIVDLHPPKAVGAISGLTNMAIILGGVILLPTVGFILHHLWDGNVMFGIRIYSHAHFQIALLVLPISFLLAFITSFLVKETHCEKTHIY